MNEPFWLNEAIVRAMHSDQLDQHGGLAGCNENLLGATLARPQNLFAYGNPTPTIFELAAIATGLQKTMLLQMVIKG